MAYGINVFYDKELAEWFHKSSKYTNGVNEVVFEKDPGEISKTFHCIISDKEYILSELITNLRSSRLFPKRYKKQLFKIREFLAKFFTEKPNANNFRKVTYSSGIDPRIELLDELWETRHTHTKLNFDIELLEVKIEKLRKKLDEKKKRQESENQTCSTNS